MVKHSHWKLITIDPHRWLLVGKPVLNFNSVDCYPACLSDRQLSSQCTCELSEFGVFVKQPWHHWWCNAGLASLLRICIWKWKLHVLLCTGLASGAYVIRCMLLTVGEVGSPWYSYIGELLALVADTHSFHKSESQAYRESNPISDKFIHWRHKAKCNIRVLWITGYR